MENFNGSLLSPLEQTMYQNFLAKNPGVTEADFKELRDLALHKTGGVKKFFALQGIVMEEAPAAEELSEIKDSHIID